MFLCGCAVLSFARVAAAQDRLKIAVVDVSKIFSGYYKTKEIEKTLAETRGASARELDTRLESHHRLLEEIARLDKELNNPALDASTRADRQKKHDDKVQETRTLERENQELRTNRDRDLQEMANRLRNQIVEDIMVVVRARVESDHYDLVLNKSAQGPGGKILVLHANASLEITDDVITTLNSHRPGATPAASPEP